MTYPEKLHSLAKLLQEEMREDCVEQDIWCSECKHKDLCDILGDYVKEYEREYDELLTRIIEHKIAERKRQHD